MFKVVVPLTMITLLALADAPVLKTGQTVVYKINDDGTYQTGIARSYSRSAAGVVTDNATGLQWQDDMPSVAKPLISQASFDANDFNNTAGDTAQTYCTTLALDGGGWRIPAIKELVGITDKGRMNPGIDPIFQNSVSDFYWSKTVVYPDDSSAWVVDFSDSNDNTRLKSSSYYVRCVR